MQMKMLPTKRVTDLKTITRMLAQFCGFWREKVVESLVSKTHGVGIVYYETTSMHLLWLKRYFDLYVTD
jgi:hypothetical protein